MKLAILESPYAGNVDLHERYARACMHDMLTNHGEAPYASHLLYTQEGVLDDDDPDERQHGIHAGFAWRQAAEYTVVYQDLGISKGMEYGIRDSAEKGRPIVYRTLPADALASVLQDNLYYLESTKESLARDGIAAPASINEMIITVLSLMLEQLQHVVAEDS